MIQLNSNQSHSLQVPALTDSIESISSTGPLLKTGISEVKIISLLSAVKKIIC